MRRDGAYRIGRRCRRLIQAAERLAEELGADTVVFSGWSPAGGPSEAAQMRDAWAGPEVELVVEPTATVTAENAARTVPLLVERGVERAVVVCAPLHLYRARFFFTPPVWLGRDRDGLPRRSRPHRRRTRSSGS